jgi:large subunit ribosomal protein L25
MAKGFDLIAEIREDAGKGSSRRLRREGKVPAIIYGGGKPPRPLSFDRNSLMRHMEQEAFFSSVINVKVGDKEQPAILKDVQMHPARRMVLHMDLQRIVATEKIRMSVPIHYLNEAAAVGVKQGGGTVSHLYTEVEITCLPKDLPEYLEVDIGGLGLDEMLYLTDIKLPEGVEIPELVQGDGTDRPIVSIHVVKVAVEPEEGLEAAEAEGEAPPAAAAPEEEKPAEGGD